MEKKREKRGAAPLALLLMVVLLVFVCVEYFRLQEKIVDAERKQLTLQEQADALTQENGKLSDALERTDDPEYLQELARAAGFVSPGQKDFYDISN